MKLYSVSARWKPKGARKWRGAFGCVIAENAETAKEKFKAAIWHPKDLPIYIDAYEEKTEVCVTNYK